MAQIFSAEGEVIPITVIEAGPCKGTSRRLVPLSSLFSKNLP
jgi:ribosomal protein L3